MVRYREKKAKKEKCENEELKENLTNKVITSRGPKQCLSNQSIEILERMF